MSKAITFQVSSLVSLLMTMSLAASAYAANDADNNSLTKQALTLFKEGKIQQAQELEEKIVKEKPNDWLAHSAMSYFYWQEGNVPDAIVEGQKSVRHSSNNPEPLVNLAHMYQTLGNYPEAIACYEKACKLEPENWIAWIGLARSYIGYDHKDDGLAVLERMSALKNDNFEWNYNLGDTYLIIDKPALAIEPLRKAKASAKNSDEKTISTARLLTALLRDNQVESARVLQSECFNQACPKESEPYVRAASQLLSSDEPDKGAELLNTATKNLDNIADSEGFFRLGRIFEDKANAITDATKSGAWLDNAVKSFQQAIELNPGQAKHHLALAAIYERQNKAKEMSDELSQAKLCDNFDQVPPFLASSAVKAAKSNQSQSLGLAKVYFMISGLTCNCQATKFDQVLRSIKGVALVTFSHLAPYGGILLIDPSQVTSDEILIHPIEAALPALKVQPRFVIISRKEIKSIDEAIAVTNDARYPNVLHFPRQFQAMQPTLPTALLTEKTASTNSTKAF
jgi:tetratricopeptide (TPR) repeat protein